MTGRLSRPVLACALVLAVLAVPGGEVALAQEREPPGRLWEEYPLDPPGETGDPTGTPGEKATGGPLVTTTDGSVRERRSDDASGSTAADRENFPFVTMVIVIAVLVVLLLVGGVVAYHGGGAALPVAGRLRPHLARLPVRLRTGAAALPSRSARLAGRLTAPRTPRWLTERPGSEETVPARPGAVATRTDAGKRARPPRPAKPAPKPVARAKPVKSDDGDGAGPQKPRRSARKPPPPRAAASSPAPAKKRAPRKPPAAKARRPAPPPPASKPAARRQALPPEPPPAKPRKAERTETCVIVWARDGLRSDFYAVSSGLRGWQYVVARSPEFDWAGGDVPPEAFAAHEALVETLLDLGWRPVPAEGPWFRLRFDRVVEIDA